MGINFDSNEALIGWSIIMAQIRQTNLVIGLTQPSIEVMPLPIKQTRDPFTTDRAPIGQTWINKLTNSFWRLTSIVNNVSNWEPGGGAATLERLAGNVGNATPTAGTITILGTQGALFTGAAAALTNSYERLELGALAARLTATNNAFSADNTNLQSFVDTTGGTVGQTFTAIRGDINVVTGDGTESPAGVHAEATAAAASNIDSVFGLFSIATVDDSSAIANDALGALNQVAIDETDAADQPQRHIAGTESALSWGLGADVPTATAVAGSIANIFYDVPLQGVAHGFVATRSGAGAGIAAGAAFKVLQGTNSLNDWNFGIDLFTGDATRVYDAADIRLQNQTVIDAGTPTTNIVAFTGQNVAVTLGDAIGVNNFQIRSSSSGTVTTIDSTGDISAGGNLSLTNQSSHIFITESGPAAAMGLVTLVAGTVTVATTSALLGSRIFLTSQSDGGTPGFLRVSSRVNATSFTITSSSATDTSMVGWILFDPFGA